MTTTQMIELEGIANWAKVFEFNKDKNEDYHGAGGAYTIDLLLDKEELDKLSASGSRLKPKVTDEGIVVRFKRKHIHPGDIEALGGPPRVVDAEKNDFPEETLIGNGSKVKIYVTVYDTKMGKGTRLEGIQVLDLVEYESDYEPSGIQLPF